MLRYNAVGTRGYAGVVVGNGHKSVYNVAHRMSLGKPEAGEPEYPAQSW